MSESHTYIQHSGLLATAGVPIGSVVVGASLSLSPSLEKCSSVLSSATRVDRIDSREFLGEFQ